MPKTEPSVFDQPNEDADELATLEGEADAEAGRVVPHAEVAAWLDTWGTPNEKPAPKSWLK
jgi:predicted transcriptional regulator